MINPEDTLMERYVSGSEEAYSALVELLAPRLTGYFRMTDRTEAEATEMTRAVFATVVRFKDQYQVGRPFRPWIFAIASRLSALRMNRVAVGA